jgi:hypothetical protein
VHALDRQLFSDDVFNDDGSRLRGKDSANQDDAASDANQMEGFEGSIIGARALQD